MGKPIIFSQKKFQSSLNLPFSCSRKCQCTAVGEKSSVATLDTFKPVPFPWRFRKKKNRSISSCYMLLHVVTISEPLLFLFQVEDHNTPTILTVDLSWPMVPLQDQAQVFGKSLTPLQRRWKWSLIRVSMHKWIEMAWLYMDWRNIVDKLDQSLFGSFNMFQPSF